MENIKSKIIPKEMKKNIDEILEQQLFNANRYYAQANPNLGELMSNELYNSPNEFLKRLIDRWDWHNSYYEQLLEPAYLNLVKENDKELSPAEIDELIDVYTTSCLVDEATLIMTGVIKNYLDYRCNLISTVDENVSRNDSGYMLITPPVETYFAQYQIDHLFYIYLLKFDKEKSNEFKKKLLSKYHANDEEIFNNRFCKSFQDVLNSNITEKDLLNKIKSYAIPDEYKVKHFYYTLEHPDRKAISNIIVYDNVDEKLIGSNLYGISGFLLRKKILKYLNDSNVLPNSGLIYEFDKDVVISALQELKNKRKKYMDKNVMPYKQKGDTCAIVCMMMALEYFGIKGRANWYDERRYYNMYSSRYMVGTPFSSLAFHFSKKGLENTIYHEDKELFNNKKGIIDDETFAFSMDEYKEILNKAKKMGTNVVSGIKINAELIREELEKGNLVILAGEIPGWYHAILVTGYDNDKFIVCDPLYKSKKMISTDELNKFMSTTIGKWFISVNNKTREKSELLSRLDSFNKQASSFMQSNGKARELKNEKN